MKGKDWLDDNIIWAAQRLLKETIASNFHGLQSPLCGQNLNFVTVPLRCSCIQIIHINGNHWVAISNVDPNTGNAVPDRIFIYDSLLSKKINSETKKQICALIHPSSKYIRFEVMNVMRQPNRYDCGVLSIAASTDIALAFNPAKSVWDIN